ncbi:MAG: TAXI family TRAP transporter solute-binding subunit [Parvibaculum sp.]|nr:TAXI family TRAP transporter solute-binding subunit [Parvibaculum sp.]
MDLWSKRGIVFGQKGAQMLAHPLSRWVAGGIGAGLLMGIVILVYWRAPASFEGEAAHITFFQIGTGPSDEAYFAWGGRLAAIISRTPNAGPCERDAPCGVEGVLAVVKSSAGSVANVRAVATHHVQSALIQSLVLDQAAHATGAFRGEKPTKSLRAIANIQRETLFLVAGRASGIATPADMEDKRVGFGLKGSAADYAAQMVLRAYSIGQNKIDTTYAEPERLSEMLLRNQLDAFFFVGHDPSAFIADLSNRGAIDIVPIADEQAQFLIKGQRILTPTIIADDAYRFIPQVSTLGVNVIWVCDMRESAFLIRDLTEALFYSGNRSLLPAGQSEKPGSKDTDKAIEQAERKALMRQASSNLVIELHPGAEQFYRQQNVLNADVAP